VIQIPYVNIPTDLSKIKSRVAFNLSKRQLVCFGAAAGVGVPAYLFTRRHIGDTAAMVLMIAIMLPAFLLAMYERDGLPAEKVLFNFIRARFLWPGVRPYKTDNFYGLLSKEDAPIGTKETENPAAKR
jgi:hypothetical protein